MRAYKICLTAIIASLVPGNVYAEDAFTWPDGQRMAISLSYDDALDSQLDNALPALNRHGLVASFYLTLASPTIRTRLEDWREAAMRGHELGNHTIFHPCRADLPDRGWVVSYRDLADYEKDEILDEIIVANAYLHAIDGRTERTLTPPCGDALAGGENYITAVKNLFVAVKSFESGDPAFAASWAPTGVSAAKLVERVKEEAAKGTRLLNIVFHGIGGDHLAVSSEEHERFLDFLADNQETYWVDSYINIMKYATETDTFDAPLYSRRAATDPHDTEGELQH